MFDFQNNQECLPALLEVLYAVHSLKDIEVIPPCNTWENVLEHTLLIKNADSGRDLFDIVSTQNVHTPFPKPTHSHEWVPNIADAILSTVVYFFLWASVTKGINALS